MLHLVDGYNFLFRLGIKGKTLEEARKKLLSHLNELASIKKLQLIVVFDGKREQGLGFSRHYFEGIEVIYTADGISADDFIIEMLDREENPKIFKVITSDLQLAKEVRRKRALAASIDEFLEEKKSLTNGPREKRVEEDPKWYRARLEKIFEERLEKEKNK